MSKSVINMKKADWLIFSTYLMLILIFSESTAIPVKSTTVEFYPSNFSNITGTTMSLDEGISYITMEPCKLDNFQQNDARKTCPILDDREADCPIDDAALDICCACFNLCCSQDADDTDTTVILTENSKSSSTQPDSSFGNQNITTTTKVTKVVMNDDTSTTKRLTRSTASKTSRGTGGGAIDEDDDQSTKDEPWSTVGRKEIEETITTAEMEEEVSEPVIITSTTTKLPPTSCSSKSKRCEDEQEPDLLDEFFPPKDKGNKGNKSKRIKRQMSLGTVVVDGMYQSTQLVKSGGLIGVGEIVFDEITTEESSTQESEVNNPMRMTQIVLENESDNSTTSTSDEPETLKPKSVTPSMIVPKMKLGNCEILTDQKACISLLPDAVQCSKDSDCAENKKCCFYGCKPYDKVGICSLPVIY